MGRINIEGKTKLKAAMLLSVILLVLGIFIVVPLVTNFQIPILTAFGLAAILTTIITIAYIVEDIVDDKLGTKNIGPLGEMITIIILSVIILAYALDYFVTTPMSVKLLLLAITITVDKLSKPLSKFLKV